MPGLNRSIVRIRLPTPENVLVECLMPVYKDKFQYHMPMIKSVHYKLLFSQKNQQSFVIVIFCTHFSGISFERTSIVLFIFSPATTFSQHEFLC